MRRKFSGEEYELGERGKMCHPMRHTSSFYINGFIGVHHTAYAQLCLPSNGPPEISLSCILVREGEEFNRLKLTVM